MKLVDWFYGQSLAKQSVLAWLIAFVFLIGFALFTENGAIAFVWIIALIAIAAYQLGKQVGKDSK